MPTVTATFTRPADTVPYAAGDLISNVGTPVALEFVPPSTTVPVGGGSSATVPGWLKFLSARLVRASGAAPAQIRAVFLSRFHVYAPGANIDAIPVLQPVQWPSYIGSDNARFPSVPFCASLDFERILPPPRIILPHHIETGIQNQLPFTPIRVLLQAMEPFTPLSGEAFTLELSTDRTA